MKELKFLIQRVKEAKVEVENRTVGEIEKGFLVLIGVGETDSEEKADYLIHKLMHLRIFEDEKDKMNLSIKDVKGEILAVSQFTLYADCNHGNRPSFTRSSQTRKSKRIV